MDVQHKESILGEYMEFVFRLRKNRAIYKNLETAIAETISTCMKDGILLEYLMSFEKNRGCHCHVCWNERHPRIPQNIGCPRFWNILYSVADTQFIPELKLERF